MEIKAIIEKLRKLIMHEQSARTIGNVAEAEAFASKIQDLLTAHKLGMSDVEFDARDANEPVGYERVDYTEIRGAGHQMKVFWILELAGAVARVNGCESLVMMPHRRARSARSIAFVGRTSDRELAKIVFIYLAELCEELAAKSTKEERDEQAVQFLERNNLPIPFWIDREQRTAATIIPPYAKSVFRKWMANYTESWKTGFSSAVSKRLDARYSETLAASGKGGALVHIKKDALAVKEFLSGENVRQAPVRTSSTADGYEAGQSMGESVNLSPNRFDGAKGRASRLLGS